jgi:nucleoside-diphosphate-sugar epimerase
MFKRIIVTGGSGFIGTNLISHLKSIGYDVMNLDVKEPCNNADLDVFNLCDITEYNTFSSLVLSFKPDVIINLAARTDLDGCEITDYNVNTVGVENLCKIALNCNTLKKILFASSMLVGEVGGDLNSISDFSAKTVYGHSKVEGELIVRKYESSLPVFIIFRPTSIWGPWFREPYRNFFDVVLLGRFFSTSRAYGKKTYGFIDNAVHQIESLMLTSKNLSKVNVYLGDSKPYDISSWAELIAKHSRSKSISMVVPYFFIMCLAKLGDIFKLVNINFPMSSFRLQNMMTKNIIDCSIVTTLNIYNEIDIEDGVINTLKWMNKYYE